MQWHQIAINQINDLRLPHRNFIRCTREAAARLESCQPGELLRIYGPSRVGKSSLADDVLESIYGRIDPLGDKLPYASVIAANASTAGSFSTGGFTRKALRVLRHPVHCDTKTIAHFSKLQNYLRRLREDELRDELIDLLRLREIKVLVCDEMQNVIYVPGGVVKASWFLDSLKCAAADAGIVLVIIGTYAILPALDLCDQLIGRSDSIHFPRYRASGDDLLAWEEILGTYSTLIPFRKTSGSLRDWNELLYIGSNGCVGLLSKWLRSAISQAGINKSNYLTKEHLVYTLRTNAELATLRRAATLGESFITGEKMSTTSQPVAKQKTKPERPFQQKPHRYTATERLEE